MHGRQLIPSTNPEFRALPPYIIDALQVAGYPGESACTSLTVPEVITPGNRPSNTKPLTEPRLCVSNTEDLLEVVFDI
jgi:hypothetical protein